VISHKDSLYCDEFNKLTDLKQVSKPSHRMIVRDIQSQRRKAARGDAVTASGTSPWAWTPSLLFLSPAFETCSYFQTPIEREWPHRASPP